MMETNKAVIGAIFFIALVIGANFIMYGIARGAAKSNQKSFLESMGNMFNPVHQKKDNSMDELRQQMEKLNGEKKDPPPPAPEP